MTAIDVPNAPRSATHAPPTRDATEPSARATLLAAWAVLLVLGAVQAWSARHHVNPDGVSYLDLADFFAAGRWGDAISSYWSPLFPWMLGWTARLLRPSPYFEASLAHVVLFATYVLCAAAFELFRRELSRSAAWFSAPAGIAVTYAVFVWSGIVMTGLEQLTPDALVAAAVFTATALLLRAERGVDCRRTYVALGVTLGVGYWAKAALFPAAFVFFAAATLAAWRSPLRRRAIARTALAPLVFALVAAPLVAAISVAKGRVTFGDVGKLAYGWFVDGYPQFWWTGQPAGSGTPVHPMRQILAEPRVLEFGGEVNGSYPLWFDPPHWYEGLEVRVAPARQADRFFRGVREYIALFGLLVALALLPALVARGVRGVAQAVSRAAVVLLPSAAMLGLYALVLVESRYVSAPAAVLCLCLLSASARTGALSDPVARGATRASAWAIVLFVVSTLVPLVPGTARALWAQLRQGEEAHREWSIARRLNDAGVRRGDRVGTVGGGTMMAYWPRLAGVRVVAQAPDPPHTTSRLDSVTTAMFGAGVRAVVLDPASVPVDRPAPGPEWVPLDDAGHFVRVRP